MSSNELMGFSLLVWSDGWYSLRKLHFSGFPTMDPTKLKSLSTQGGWSIFYFLYPLRLKTLLVKPKGSL